jgi:hypothetical protein
MKAVVLLEDLKAMDWGNIYEQQYYNNNTTTTNLTAAIVVLIFTTATLAVAGTIAVGGSDHAALAWKKNDGGKKSGNEGVSVPTITITKQKCQSAGGTSRIESESCTATSTNTITESGGVVGEP